MFFQSVDRPVSPATDGLLLKTIATSHSAGGVSPAVLCHICIEPSLDDHLYVSRPLLSQMDEVSDCLLSHIRPLLLSRLFLSETSLIASFSHCCWQFSTSVLREPPLPRIVFFLLSFFFSWSEASSHFRLPQEVLVRLLYIRTGDLWHNASP